MSLAKLTAGGLTAALLIGLLMFSARMIYRAGWDARGELAIEQDVSAIAANEHAAQSASQTLYDGMDALTAYVSALNARVKEIRNVPQVPGAVCGMPVDQLRDLEAIK